MSEQNSRASAGASLPPIVSPQTSPHRPLDTITSRATIPSAVPPVVLKPSPSPLLQQKDSPAVHDQQSKPGMKRKERVRRAVETFGGVDVDKLNRSLNGPGEGFTRRDLAVKEDIGKIILFYSNISMIFTYMFSP